MGFYDRKIKKLYEKCPRLVILSINSIFHKNHLPEAELLYLDKEQNVENETFMDMLLSVEDCKYHFEFQLLEDNMAIRMYEYGIKETIREISHTSNQIENQEEREQGEKETKLGISHVSNQSKQQEKSSQSKYEIEVIMPAQAVIFLAGSNTADKIVVHLTVPDGQKIVYSLPCISASVSIEELIKANLFILIPFQQVQLNSRMNRIKECEYEIKVGMGEEIHQYHEEVKRGLEKLYVDAIISLGEYENLIEVLSDVEVYIAGKDDLVKELVMAMGDKDYVSWSDRMREEGRKEAEQEIRQAKQEAEEAKQRIKELEKLLAEQNK